MTSSKESKKIISYVNTKITFKIYQISNQKLGSATCFKFSMPQPQQKDFSENNSIVNTFCNTLLHLDLCLHRSKLSQINWLDTKNHFTSSINSAAIEKRNICYVTLFGALQNCSLHAAWIHSTMKRRNKRSCEIYSKTMPALMSRCNEFHANEKWYEEHRRHVSVSSERFVIIVQPKWTLLVCQKILYETLSSEWFKFLTRPQSTRHKVYELIIRKLNCEQ